MRCIQKYLEKLGEKMAKNVLREQLVRCAIVELYWCAC